jgi:glycosyltransferase involved in cell wall biosynthesis
MSIRKGESAMNPVVTVLIRTYNNQETIETALNSVIHQTIYPRGYSILVVDDGSTDESIKLVQKHHEVTLLKTDHRGSLAALNTGLECVKTPYVILLDSDDWFEPTILESMCEIFKQKPSTGFVYSDYYEVVNHAKQVVSVRDNIFNTVAAGIMFSTQLLRSAGFYDESMIFAEYDLLIRLLPIATRHYIPTPLYSYVRHPRSITADKSIVQLGRKQLFEKYGQHYLIRDY